MPVPIKIIFSLVVLGVAVAGYFFLDWLGQAKNQRWVDVGCGNGAVVPPGASSRAWIVRRWDRALRMPAIANSPHCIGLGQWPPNTGRLSAPTTSPATNE